MWQVTIVCNWLRFISDCLVSTLYTRDLPRVVVPNPWKHFNSDLRASVIL